MRRAVLVASARTLPGEGRPAALLHIDGETVIARLRRQLHSLGITDIMVLARPKDAQGLRANGFAVLECDGVADDLRALDRLATQGPAGLLLCAADLVASDTSLGTVVAAAGSQNAILAVSSPEGAPSPLQPSLVSQRGRLVRVERSGAESESPATVLFGGVIATDQRRLRTAVAARTVNEGVLGDEDVLTLVLPELARTGEPLLVQRTPGLPTRRVSDATAAAETSSALAAVDEDATRLRLAVKRRDDLFATFCVSSFSPRLVRWAAHLGLTPTAVTWLSVGLALSAAIGFGQGTRPWLVVGAVLLYVSFVLDCVDGQLARYTLQYSRFGGWLDAVADRGKEYLVYAGLAVGAVRTETGDVWPLALAAMVLLTTRHMTDTWYGALQDLAVAGLARGSDDGPRPRAAARSLVRQVISRVGALLGDASGKVHSNRGSVAYWLKRTVVLPIGERWLLVAVSAMVFDARVALLALLTWGVVAAAYTLFGRTLRTLHMRVSVMADVDRHLYRDDGPVAQLLGRLGRGVLRPLPAALLPALVAGAGVMAQLFGAPLTTGQIAVAAALAAVVPALAAAHPHDGWLGWLIPAALRLSESAVVILFGLYAGLPTPLLYTLIGVVALYHYDLTARLERSRSPVRWRALGLGWDGRVVLLGVATLLGVAGPAFIGLTVYLATVYAASALVGSLPGLRGTDETLAGASLPQHAGTPTAAEKVIPAEAPEPV